MVSSIAVTFHKICLAHGEVCAVGVGILLYAILFHSLQMKIFYYTYLKNNKKIPGLGGGKECNLNEIMLALATVSPLGQH